MADVKTKVTLVGTVLAKQGVEFIYEGETAACETCNTRCPNEVELVNVMDTLREMAIEEGVKGKEQDIVSMHKTFLSLIKSLGRQHEISLLVLLKMKTKEFFKDMFLGMKMFVRGKLKILPHRIKGMDEIKGIFERSKTK